jgi:hypothetical protein
VFEKQPDLTKNNGTTSSQIQLSVENESKAIPISSAQSFKFLSHFNRDQWDIHTLEFTMLPDFFLIMQEQDPKGLYILEFKDLNYDIPDTTPEDLKDVQMFNYCIFIPSACKHFYERGMQIAVIDGAHLYTKFEGVMLTLCTKDGEGHIVEIGFAIVPVENKYFWQEFLNAIFFYLSHHRMIMSDKATGTACFYFLFSGKIV